MAEPNKAVKGEQPKGNQKDPQKEMTHPSASKAPAAGKARTGTSASPKAKTSARASATSSSRAKNRASATTAKKDTGSVAKTTENEPMSDSLDEKVMVLGVTDEVMPIESAFGEQDKPAQQEVPPVAERDEYVQSVADQLNPGEEERGNQEDRDQDSPKSRKDDKPKRKVRKLEKKAEKAERKVDKLMDKYKTARQDQVKRGKLQTIKDKLLKAYAKLRKRHRKLRKAQA